LSQFLRDYPMSDGVTVEKIQSDFHPRHSTRDEIESLLLSRGHVIQEGTVVTTNESKMLEFLEEYKGSSLSHFAHDYWIWRKVPYKISLDYHRVRRFLEEKTTRSWSSGENYFSG